MRENAMQLSDAAKMVLCDFERIFLGKRTINFQLTDVKEYCVYHSITTDVLRELADKEIRSEKNRGFHDKMKAIIMSTAAERLTNEEDYGASIQYYEKAAHLFQHGIMGYYKQSPLCLSGNADFCRRQIVILFTRQAEALETKDDYKEAIQCVDAAIKTLSDLQNQQENNNYRAFNSEKLTSLNRWRDQLLSCMNRSVRTDSNETLPAAAASSAPNSESSQEQCALSSRLFRSPRYRHNPYNGRGCDIVNDDANSHSGQRYPHSFL